jgi:transposase-like protein
VPNSTQAKWVRQARINRGDVDASDQGQITSGKRAELIRLRTGNRELKREKDFFKLAAAHFAREQLPPKGFA